MCWWGISVRILFSPGKSLIRNSTIRSRLLITRRLPLVKTLEEQGIGRPSTYAPTIAIILGRRYVTKEGKNLYLTEIGEVVNNMMKQSFPVS